MTNGKACRGFTLIELLVVLAIVATLTALAAPRYITQVERGRETVLKHNLRSLREALDQYVHDRGQPPSELEALVTAQYLRDVPLDPVTARRDTWEVERGPMGQVVDVRSGAPGKATDGTAYSEW